MSVTSQQYKLDIDIPGDFFGHRALPLTIKEGLDEAAWIIERAKSDYGPIVRSFLMLSGGNDSMVVLDVCGRLADEIVHINTGIGIPQTNAFVRATVAAIGRDLTELHPPVPYDDLILDEKLFGGFPGPAAHHFAYARLKERCVWELLRSHRTKRGQRFMLLTGIRNDESRRRMGYGTPIDRTGGQVWVNPLIRWSNDLMREYRETRDLPVNEVTKHLHMSGECLCGAFARPGELEEISFFYPEFGKRIAELEARVAEKGLPNAKWGERPPKKAKTPAGRMCTSCTLFDSEESA